MKVESSVKTRCRRRQGVVSRTLHNTNQDSTSALVTTETMPMQKTNTVVITNSASGSKTDIFSLPSELITRIAFHLTLPEYSYLSRTCKTMNAHFQRELILFLRHVYGRSVRSGSLILFAYGAHLQYRAPRLLDRIMDEFFIDANDNPGNSNSKNINISRQANSRWPTYWSVLYSLDKAPNLDPPPNCITSVTCSSDDKLETCYLQSHQNTSCYECTASQFHASEQSSNPKPKLQFLEKYAARMNAKFANRPIRGNDKSSSSHSNGRRNEWHLSDVRQKKTYRMLIMQNIRYGDTDLLRFYLENYGAPINGVVRFTPEEQVGLMQDRGLVDLLEKYGIHVVVTE
ncbi:11134_t:CDS:2 [Acaulospora morrowiae]|uniref:11134_t:CDS:1 n=1 Tax=Acaulospora morrowiae TaxID=94023 RepID=A0A9N8W1K2_9GLOM|nr:11134_t:CDS:2 [Acaulospora morrowiae]